MLSNSKLLQQLEKPLFSAAHILERSNIFSQLYSKQQEASKNLPKKDIRVYVKGNSFLKGFSWQLRPIDILSQIKDKKSNDFIAAKVIYQKESLKEEEIKNINEQFEQSKEFHVYDLRRPLEDNCLIEFLSFKDPLGQKVFWHSSAHILGAILEQEYNGYLNSGPAVDDGFYYDIYIGDQKIHASNFENLEKKINKFIQEGHKFERLVLSKSEAQEMFKDNPFKLDIINNKIPENGVISAYRCGSFIDLCKGPHLPSVSYVKALKLMNLASANWEGQEIKKSVDRVYGISFPSKAELAEYLEWQKKVAYTDHRNIGLRQELYFSHASSPAAGFFYPAGARIYNKLIDLVRKEYRIRGYQEVISPCMFNSSLWDVSGHSCKFSKNMFQINVEDHEYGLKPMNCPSHCLIFGSKLHSYRDLPIRYADFGVLHRNEVSGSLQGLIRVRKFQQDDSHIFCRVDQIMDEVMGVLKFMEYVYSLFGFEYKMILSTKPQNALGSEEIWNKAEKALANALNSFGKPWEVALGDGAFYGPKIEVHIKDVRKRYFQCGTVQLDFIMPERFDLKYRVGDKEERDEEEKKFENKIKGKGQSQTHGQSGLLKSKFERPVMVHRAILGSIERFLAIMIEHVQGALPFWLSPKQIKVIPINERIVPYAQKIFYRMQLEGYDVEMDKSRANDKLAKKVREAHLQRFNYALIIGEQEAEKDLVSIRDLQQLKDLGKMSIPELLSFLKSKDVPVSQAEVELREKAFYSPEEKCFVEELLKLDEELRFKVLFDDESKEPGERDRMIFEKVQECKVKKEEMPNLYRWSQFMRKFV